MKAYIPFVIAALIAQFLILILFAIFADYSDQLKPRNINVSDTTNNSITRSQLSASPPTDVLPGIYPYFQDVQGMIFLGFGFLMVFLKKYGFSSVGINFFLAVFSIQWALIINGFLYMKNWKFQFDGNSLLGAEFATAAVLISFGAVLGKTTPLQLLLMAFIEIPVFVVNEYIGRYLMKVTDTGDTLFVHIFGAYFGLFMSRIITKPSMTKSKNEESYYHSDLFSMIGTLILWIFWPSFNSAGVLADRRYRAVINTFCSLLGSTMMTFIVSIAVERGRINMVHIANASLAGGVSIGAAADLMLRPAISCLIGMIAGTMSTIGYKYLTPILNRKGFHDTCGVNNLHGITGIFGGFVVAVASIFATKETYGSSLTDIFSAMPSRTNYGQLGFQLLALFSTFAIAMIGGLLTGFILDIKQLRLQGPLQDPYFSDELYWMLPEDFDFEQKNEVKSKDDHILLSESQS